MIELVALAPDDDALLEAFHRGLYWSAFERQHEPLAVWREALRGERTYELRVRIAREGDEIVGGIAYERYPASGCGLLTYVVVAPAARRHGLGQRLVAEAARELFDGGAAAVFGEVNDPERATAEPAAVAWERLRRIERWGGRILDVRYVQPALAPGLARDRGLALVAFGAEVMAGETVRRFVDELYQVTEGGPPDPEISIPDVVSESPRRSSARTGPRTSSR